MRCCCDTATHAIIGSSPKLGQGVLFWHDNEFDAHRDARDLRADGAQCRVVLAPGGDLSPSDIEDVFNRVVMVGT